MISWCFVAPRPRREGATAGPIPKRPMPQRSRSTACTSACRRGPHQAFVFGREAFRIDDCDGGGGGDGRAWIRSLPASSRVPDEAREEVRADEGHEVPKEATDEASNEEADQAPHGRAFKIPDQAPHGRADKIPDQASNQFPHETPDWVTANVHRGHDVRLPPGLRSRVRVL
jgi:hypothetical protein